MSTRVSSFVVCVSSSCPITSSFESSSNLNVATGAEPISDGGGGGAGGGAGGAAWWRIDQGAPRREQAASVAESSVAQTGAAAARSERRSTMGANYDIRAPGLHRFALSAIGYR